MCISAHVGAIPSLQSPSNNVRDGRRISEIDESTEDASPPTFSGKLFREEDKFDNVALLNLFAPLIAG
jgi:hypothetical protein